MWYSILSAVSFSLDPGSILGDLWLPLSPWSLYNSNCAQICKSLECHFHMKNPRYAHCDLVRQWQLQQTCYYSPHKYTFIFLSLHLQAPKAMRQSDWQLMTAKHDFPYICGWEWLTFWQKNMTGDKCFFFFSSPHWVKLCTTLLNIHK